MIASFPGSESVVSVPRLAAYHAAPTRSQKRRSWTIVGEAPPNYSRLLDQKFRTQSPDLRQKMSTPT